MVLLAIVPRPMNFGSRLWLPTIGQLEQRRCWERLKDAITILIAPALRYAATETSIVRGVDDHVILWPVLGPHDDYVLARPLAIGLFDRMGAH